MTRRSPIRAKPADDRRVVAEQPVAVELHELVGEGRHELQGARPAEMPRELDARPDAASVRVRRPAVAGASAWLNHGAPRSASGPRAGAAVRRSASRWRR